MCWAYRVADVGVRAANPEIARPHGGRIVTSGRQAPVLIRRMGEFMWLDSRHGMMLPGERNGRNLVWNARDDRLENFEAWARLIRQRHAVPVDAYSDAVGAEVWRTGPAAFALGFYDTGPEGGSVVITEQDGDGRPPVLVSRADAARWLEANQWDALSVMRSMARVRYAEVDLFEGKRLAADARTRVPLRRAA